MLIIASVVCLSACSEDDSRSPDTPLATSYTRVTTDQPDPIQYENTVHIVYAVPSGNEDKGRDKNYQLQQSIIAADTWFYGISSGKQIRLDLQYNGDVDITYWPMTETNAELHQSRWGMRDTIEDKLKQTVWYNPNKLYVYRWLYGGDGQKALSAWFTYTINTNRSILNVDFIGECAYKIKS